MRFCIGDRVHWSSKGAERTGVVVDIVPEGRLPNTQKYRGLKSLGGARNHESYIVEGQEVVNGKLRCYWPVVKLLLPNGVDPQRLQFEYTNHRGETAIRTVRVEGMRWAENEWLLVAWDYARSDRREFVVSKMKAIDNV